MRWLWKCLGFTCSGAPTIIDSSEDQFKEEMELAIALSKSEQEQIAKQNRDVARLEEQEQRAAAAAAAAAARRARARAEKERKRLLQAQIDEDELIAKTVQESLNMEESSRRKREEEERQKAKAQLDDEQLAKAIQNSLNEKENQDEQLAKIVQESLYMKESPPRVKEDADNLTKAKIIQKNNEGESSRRRQEKGKKKECEDDMSKGKDQSSGTHPHQSICAGCKSEIEHGRDLNFLGAAWHPQCFRCLHCHQLISTREFSNSRGQFHKSCYREHHHPKCYICKEKIPITEKGVEFKAHRFWSEKYCPSHERDGTFQCCSCERVEPWETNYVILEDERRQCLECYSSAIVDTCGCHALHFEIRDFLGSLHMKVDKEFPVLLVESSALNRAKDEENIGYQDEPVTRGICLSEEHTVRNVSKGSRKGPNNRLIGMETKYVKLTRECEVTAILIMFGLPRLLTGYIMAHEMMHAWLKLSGYRDLDPQLEEGICQVVAHLWLESQTYSSSDDAAIAAAAAAPPPSSSSSSSQLVAADASKKGDQPAFERRLVDFFKWQIENDKSVIYGDGFRKVYKPAIEYGVRSFVERPEFSRR